MIQTLAQWEEIAEEFVSEANSVGIMSIDTESLLQPEAVRLSKSSTVDYTQANMGVVWVISTSGLGLTVRFDVRRLRASRYGSQGKGKHFGTVLPEGFVSLLDSNAIVKVGSGILGDIVADFAPTDLRLQPVLELQRFVQAAKGAVFDDDISVATGLDYVCNLLFGFSYKPIKVKRKAPILPGALTYQMYNWPLQLPPRSHNYLRNDAILHVAFVLEVVRRLDVEASSLRAAISLVIDSFVDSDSSNCVVSAASGFTGPAVNSGLSLLDLVESAQLRRHRQEKELELDLNDNEMDRFPEDPPVPNVVSPFLEETELWQSPEAEAPSNPERAHSLRNNIHCHISG